MESRVIFKKIPVTKLFFKINHRNFREVFMNFSLRLQKNIILK